MEPLSVKTENGKILIEQRESGQEMGVVVDPAQVPTLIQWLEEAVIELLQPKRGLPASRKDVSGLQ